MQALLAAGADPSVPAAHGAAPLALAASYGHTPILRALLAAGADMEATCLLSRDIDAPMTALQWAAWEGHEECLRALLAAGASLEPQRGAEFYPALSLAAGEGHKGCVCALLEAGAPVEARGSDGNTALIVACYGGHEDCMAALAAAGADLEARGSRGTALQVAVACRQGVCATALVGLGARTVSLPHVAAACPMHRSSRAPCAYSQLARLLPRHAFCSICRPCPSPQLLLCPHNIASQGALSMQDLVKLRQMLVQKQSTLQAQLRRYNIEVRQRRCQPRQQPSTPASAQTEVKVLEAAQAAAAAAAAQLLAEEEAQQQQAARAAAKAAKRRHQEAGGKAADNAGSVAGPPEMLQQEAAGEAEPPAKTDGCDGAAAMDLPTPRVRAERRWLATAAPAAQAAALAKLQVAVQMGMRWSS